MLSKKKHTASCTRKSSLLHEKYYPRKWQNFRSSFHSKRHITQRERDTMVSQRVPTHPIMPESTAFRPIWSGKTAYPRNTSLGEWTSNFYGRALSALFPRTPQQPGLAGWLASIEQSRESRPFREKTGRRTLGNEQRQYKFASLRDNKLLQFRAVKIERAVISI